MNTEHQELFSELLELKQKKEELRNAKRQLLTEIKIKKSLEITMTKIKEEILSEKKELRNIIEELKDEDELKKPE